MAVDHVRPEQEIFDDLARLCISPGYVHAIAYFCFRDSVVRFAGEMTAEDLRHLFSPSRLIRTEIATLVGLSMKSVVSYELPDPGVLQQYLDQTEVLLEELHQAIARSCFDGLDLRQAVENGVNPFSRGEALREPIFYNGESAYSFQYRDLSTRKYAADNEWLKTNKGFSIDAARDVAHTVARRQTERLSETLALLRRQRPDNWTLLPCFSFTLDEISRLSGIEEAVVEKVLLAFSTQDGERNRGFNALHDFNVANAVPLMHTLEGTFITFGYYGFAEALYESPFYWMSSDRNYFNTAMIHRGRFTEEFSRERLELVFGKSNVHANVDIYEGKDKKVGEIDVLVLFGNRAIVLQAKSKRLTLESRRGNDRQIKEDFQKSVQDSYNQAYKCARLLGNPKYKLVGSDLRQVTIPGTPKEIYILCVVSDSYPALNFQAQQLLNFQRTEAIYPPLIADVFTLDAMTEMLASPLYFLSYINRRTGYYERLLARDELTLLSWHLKRNLWVEKGYDVVMVGDEISADLDIAMAVRRDNVPGKRTPEGILTRVSTSVLGQIVAQIEAQADGRTIDLGLVLLRLSEHAVLQISKGIAAVASKARQDGKNHDMSVSLSEAGSGLTFHCNDEPHSVASPRLQRHCEMRKYIAKADSWFGICLSPSDNAVKFGINLDHKWQSNAGMDAAAKRFIARNSGRKINLAGPRSKIGRNEPCPCGSGLKSKKCCLK